VDWHEKVRGYLPHHLAVMIILTYDTGTERRRHANETLTGDFLYLCLWYIRAGPVRRLQRQGRQRQPCAKYRHDSFAGPRAWQQCQWANHERACRSTTDQSAVKQGHTRVIGAAYEQLRNNNSPKTRYGLTTSEPSAGGAVFFWSFSRKPERAGARCHSAFQQRQT
jgi:hypothetical protein